MLIRNFLFYTFLISTTLLYGIFTPIVMFTPRKIKYMFGKSWAWLFIHYAKYFGGIEYKISGELSDKIKSHKAILVLNHQSAWETAFTLLYFPEQCWVIKKELLNIPIFGWGLRCVDPIAIDRSKASSRDQLLQQGKIKLKNNIWVVIYPEGTRRPVNSPKRFAKSPAMLSIDTDTPIIAVAHNAGEFWPRGWLLKKKGTVQVIINPEPFKALPGESSYSLISRVQSWITHNIKLEH